MFSPPTPAGTSRKYTSTVKVLPGPPTPLMGCCPAACVSASMTKQTFPVPPGSVAQVGCASRRNVGVGELVAVGVFVGVPGGTTTISSEPCR